MFTEIAENNSFSCSLLHPYPKASDRSAWEALPKGLTQELISHGEPYFHYIYPALPATLWMNFCRTGNRVDFENAQFARRIALNHLVLAECAEHQGRFLDDIINGIFAICEESAWQLPAHNSYERSQPQLLLPDSNRPVMDLFSCETAGILGCIYYLLKAELDQISPVICARMEAEIHTRIIAPYLNEHFWWMGDGTSPMNNWTIWCTQNVLLASFFTPQTEETQRAILKKACKSADYFLAEYGDDGCCDEGAQYYHHAGLCLGTTLFLLNEITHQSFASLWTNLKIQNIASYISNVHVSGPYYLNFADCSPKAGLSGTAEYLLGKNTKQPELQGFAAGHIQSEEGWIPRRSMEEHTLFFRLQEVFTLEEAKNYQIPTNIASFPTVIPAVDSIKTIDNEISHIEHSEAYSDYSNTHMEPNTNTFPWRKNIAYPSVGIYYATDDYFSLAVKAGDNADSHNHNDTGSFILYAKGQPCLIDVGVESYTKKTFSPQRYEIWTMQSSYHNLPDFLNKTTGEIFSQHDGAQYRAEDVAYHCSDKEFSVSMDLAHAYLETSGVISYLREVSFQKSGDITIHEKAVTTTPETDWCFHFMTYESPTVSGTSVTIGDLAVLSFPEGCDISIDTIPITDPRLQTAWEHELYRICVQPNSMNFTYKIERI